MQTIALFPLLGYSTVCAHIFENIADTTTPAPTTTFSPGEQANQLVNQTQDVSKLNSSQVAEVVRLLENLLAGPNISQEAGRAVLSVINNLLNASSNALGSSSNRCN